jgi:hypothetical protein
MPTYKVIRIEKVSQNKKDRKIITTVLRHSAQLEKDLNKVVSKHRKAVEIKVEG